MTLLTVPTPASTHHPAPAQPHQRNHIFPSPSPRAHAAAQHTLHPALSPPPLPPQPHPWSCSCPPLVPPPPSPTQVTPYHFDFKCHVKKRWEGKTLVDLFAEVGGRTLRASVLAVMHV